MTYHSYRQHPDAHPERPWWRQETRMVAGGLFDATPRFSVVCWVRSDGRWMSPRMSIHNQPATDDWWEHAGPDEGGSCPGDCDGAGEAMMARIDREHPLPPPTPLLGQCWVWPDGNQHMVTDVCPNAAGGLIIVLGIEGPTITTTGDDATPWPPPGAVLAAGPLGPWAPLETP